jgi:hypothetical protein
MIRRIAAGVVLLGLATFVVVQFERPASIVFWEVVVALGAVAVGWKRWPDAPGRVPSLGAGEGFGRRSVQTLAPLELELAAAVDPRLGGDRLVRRRLISLAESRAGRPAGSMREAEARRLLGDDVAAILFAPPGPMTPGDLEMAVQEIESL